MLNELQTIYRYLGQKVLPSYLVPSVIIPGLPTTNNNDNYSADDLTPEEKYQDSIVELIQSLPTSTNCNAAVQDERYYQTVLKLFIRQLEARGIAPSEKLNEAYTELLMNSKISNSSSEDSTAACYVNYFVEGSDYVRLRESPNVISAHGSTGHRTWEAALALSDYLITAGLLVDTNGRKAKKLVELGAGTGLVGLIAAKLDPALEVVLTDGDEKVVDNLRSNITLNNSGLDKTNITAQMLLWNETPVVPGTDVVLAADVTYDGSVIPHLVACLAQFVAACPTCRIIVAATIRSENTFQVFEKECTAHHLALTKLRSYTESTRHFFIPPSSPKVIIYEISKQ